MQPYSAKLTIDGLFGAFAEKYSRNIHNAHFLHTLLLKIGARASQGPVNIFEFSEEPRQVEPYPLLPRFMKYLNKVGAIQTERRFFTGIYPGPDAPELDAPLPSSVDGHDDAGAFTLHALGTRATLSRSEPEGTIDLTSEEVPSHTAGDICYHCRYGTFKELFSRDMESLVTICEETMSKDTLFTITFSKR